MRILNIGAGKSDISEAYKDAEIVTLDIDKRNKPDIVHDITKPLPRAHRGAYDRVICIHVLEHIPYEKAEKAVEHIVSAAKDGGEVLIVVPSLEWCAKELLKDTPSNAVLGALYGSHNSKHMEHRSGFTMLWLRLLMEKNGLYIRQAVQNEFYIVLNGKEYPALQNVIIGIKRERGSA